MNLSHKTRRRLRNYRGTIYLSIILMLTCIILKFMEVPPWIEDFADSIIGAIIGILLVNLMYQWRAEQDLEDDMAQNLIDVLAGQYDSSKQPRLYTLFNKTAIERILTRCIESYCANTYLANCYFNYIKNSYPLIKKDEDYIVTVTKGPDDKMFINQTLKDTRIFLTPMRKENICIFVYLVLAKGTNVSDDTTALDKILSDNKYFIREELLNPEFVDSLIAAWNDAPEQKEKSAHAVLDMLGFTAKVLRKNDRESETPATFSDSIYIPNTDIDLDFVRDESGRYHGIRIVAPIPADYISTNNDFYRQEGFIQYTAEVSFKYMAPKGRVTFYAVYASPTIHSGFKIKFKINGFDCNRDVDKMRFISFAEEDIKHGIQQMQDDGKVCTEEKTISFHTQRTIFPRSGISLSWDN